MKPSTAPSNEDLFGRIVARTLSANLEQMPYEVQERLRAGRMRAAMCTNTKTMTKTSLRSPLL